MSIKVVKNQLQCNTCGKMREMNIYTLEQDVTKFYEEHAPCSWSYGTKILPDEKKIEKESE